MRTLPRARFGGIRKSAAQRRDKPRNLHVDIPKDHHNRRVPEKHPRTTGGRLQTAALSRLEGARRNVTEETETPAVDVTGVRDVVSVRLPAVSAYLSVLRTATAGLAARLDFTLDQIEDLRIAVDEACAMILRHAVPGTDLRAEFELSGEEMTVRVEVTTLGAVSPDREGFAWMVLTALADEVEAIGGEGDSMAIVLRKRRTLARPA